jgi:hypothetical protein
MDINTEMELLLNDGRTVRLHALHQRCTYDGMLCGLPSEHLNDYLVARLLKEAAIACMANFAEIDTTPRAAIIWFQDQFALPVAPDILDRIKALDWKAVTVECLP